jgi:hypothetical protein
MATTASVTIRDAEGNVIFTKTGLTASSNTVQVVDSNNHPLQIPLSGAHTVEAQLSGGQAVTQQTIGIKLLIEG